MRISGLLFAVSVVAWTPAAAQTPLIAVAPPPTPALGPKTVLPIHVACTDVPVSAHTAGPLHIVAPYVGDRREFSSRDHIVVLNGGTPQGFAPGQRYYTRRLLPPRDGRAPSPTNLAAVRTSGWLTVIAADEHSALARIDYTCDAVAAGDYLDPFIEPTLPENVAPRTPNTDFGNLGLVLHGSDRHEAFGAGDFLSIDRGAAGGMVNGSRVAFYRDRGNGTPLLELGTGIVIEVSPNTSKVVVDRAQFEVRTGDYYALRQP